MSRLLSDRYELGALIGAGGSAAVYEARDRILDRRVAVKILDGGAIASNDPNGRRRFLSEARSSAAFAHPSVVAVYDAGEFESDLFMVMELVEGPSLAQVIADTAPMPEAEAIRIGTQLLDALGAVHASGLAHRDVKPANVLLGPDHTIKLADFGIAKRFDEMAESLTTHGMVIGTPHYLAPEQAAGRGATPQSDLYAVGVVLYEMLTGERPTATTPGVDLRSRRPDVSSAIVTTVGAALAERPQDRFDSASAMADQLTGRAVSMPRTQIMPTGGLPTREMVDAGARTTVLPGITATSAAASSATRPQTAPAQPSGQRWWLVGLLVVLAVGVAGLVLASRDGPSEATTLDPSESPAPTDVATSPTTAPVLVPLETVAPPTPPPSTETTTPPVPTEPPVVELIPGFPATDDLDQFIDQLADGKEVVGKQSKKLGEELAKLQEEDSDDRDERAQDLREQLAAWVDEGEIDSTVADAATVFIDRLSAGAGSGSDD